jgi:cell division protein ZapE
MTSGPLAAYRRLRAEGTVKGDPMQELAVEKLETLHQRLAAWRPEAKGLLGRLGLAKPQPPPQGLYLYGGVGRGKSMLMDLFFHEAPVAPKRRVHFHAFMLETHARIHAWRQLPANAPERAGGDDPIPPTAARIAAEARLLCFDEFQVSDVADAMILGRLFTELLARGVVVVATSNRAPNELYLGGLNRQLFLPFIALVERELDVLHLNGPVDYRLARLAGMPVYHAPLGPAADAELDAVFASLTDGAPPEPVTIEVQGRRLEVPRAARGVARMGFAELCERPLGAADYLALAARFHTLVLEGVPAMGPEKRNEAKRFVTLVDALYEARAKLIVSAAVPPAGLYPAGDGSFEFGRTESRLMEMQSAEYMALPHAP